MLEKAKLQQTNLSVIDPLENACKWGIPIWPLEKVNFISFINLDVSYHKVSKQIT